MKISFVLIGWLSLLGFPLALHSYLNGRGVSTKWGQSYGASAVGPLIGYCIMAIVFGGYAIKETRDYLRKRKSPESKEPKE